ncbi:MAG: hypothetical protein M1824_004355 [Vezdaea acicularis]|nr:MAG: hypothetical protein M1824_004355 [Vezdaea acicularis]
MSEEIERIRSESSPSTLAMPQTPVVPLDRALPPIPLVKTITKKARSFSDPENPLFLTTVLANNIHCASCISLISETLNALEPRPLEVDASILTHAIRIRHKPALAVRTIASHLREAGFELHSTTTDDVNGQRVGELDFSTSAQDGWLDHAAGRWSRASLGFPIRMRHGSFQMNLGSFDPTERDKRRKHIENCEACQADEREIQEKKVRPSPSRYDSQRKHSQRGRQAGATPSRDGSTRELLNDNLSDSFDQLSKLESQKDLPEESIPLERIREGSDQGHSLEVKLKEAAKVVNTHPQTTFPDTEAQYEAILSIEGMTCASCVVAITATVKQLSFVTSIDVNLLAHSASCAFTGTESHLHEIVETIEDTGFGCSVQDSWRTDTNAKINNAAIRQDVGTNVAPTFKALFSIDGMTCASCTNAVTSGLEKTKWIKSINVTLLTNSATVVFQGTKERASEILEMIEDMGFGGSLQDISQIEIPENPFTGRKLTSRSSSFKATLSLGGMTCASCTGAITTGLQDLPFVEKVEINLLANSGTVVFDGKENIDAIVEKIEALGYECTLESLISEGAQRGSIEPVNKEKKVIIRIDGMFCEHCPPRVLAALRDNCGDLVKIIEPLTLKKPIVTLTYIPHPPDFTVRNIVAAISEANDAFQVSIYHPPTIEDRSRAMQLHERRRIGLRLLLCAIIAIPTLLIGVVFMSLVPATNRIRVFFERPIWSGTVTRSDWALLILATPVYFFAADVFHTRAFKEIRAMWRKGSRVPLMRRFYRFGSMNLLLSAGTSIAYIASVAIIIMGSLQTPRPEMSGSSMTTYFDSVVFLTMFIMIGRYLEAYSKGKAGDAVTTLGKLRPTEALLLTTTKESGGSSLDNSTLDQVRSNSTKTVHVDLLEMGDVIRVPHGASPPFDGTVLEGNSSFDESSLTGESRPVAKAPDDAVFAGTLNQGQSITMVITGGSGSSLLDQIVKVVREGQTKRAPIERVADVITGYFVPVITLIAIVTFAIWIALGTSGRLPQRWLQSDSTGGWPFWSLQFAIAVFVVACPCGIGLAAPTALFVGSGLAAKHGVLVKGGGEAFQEASTLDVVVFDKTGTLTGGNPRVAHHELFAASGIADEIIWAATLSLEETSSHPIATAISTLASQKKRTPTADSEIDELPGLGLRGRITFPASAGSPHRAYEAAIGSSSLLRELGISLDDYYVRNSLSEQRSQGHSIALLALRPAHSDKTATAKEPWKLAALFATHTPLRPSALPTISALRSSGIAVYLLTGDNAQTASAVGASLNLPASNIIADVLPTGKAAKITDLQSTAPKRHNRPAKKGERAIIAMVGDGINDAPALSAADVSISLSGASGVAISSSKFILAAANPSLATILTLITLSEKVMLRVKTNFAWALVYNVCLVPLAAGILMGVGSQGVRLGPVWASAAMAASSVSVVLSSLALRSRLPWLGFKAAKVD